MHVTILGSGTLLPDAQRGSAAHLIEDGEVRMLLDAGNGVLHGLAACGTEWAALTHVALTHFHTDHIGGLPALLWALRAGAGVGPPRGPLTVLGPRGLRSRLNSMAEAFGPYILDPGFPVEIVELESGAGWSDARLELRTQTTEHTPESMAFRVEGSGSVGYTGDTGPTAGLGAFFSGVDVLVSECASADDQPRPGHLTPSGVARLTREASCELVVITHVYPHADPEELARAVAHAGVPGRCLAAFDGLVVEVGRG